MIWDTLIDILLLLLTAIVLGVICERLRQSAIVGYLAAGALLGPHGLHVVADPDRVETLAALGVSMLLFSIGLEVSWSRLRRLGAATLWGGVGQIVVTVIVGSGIAGIFGLSLGAAIALGSMIALSSTAAVLRVLMSRTELESPHGRVALGILLVQDLAVVPLVIAVSLFAASGTTEEILIDIARIIGLAIALVAGFVVLFRFLIPRALSMKTIHSNRELPILLAIVMGLGSAWLAHELDLPHALGAFVAGMLLAESPFAAQVRADIASFRTVLMTLFFTAVGMYADIHWIGAHWLAVSGTVLAIVLGKTLITWRVLRLMGLPRVAALPGAVCLAQVGEFSFVIAAVAVTGAVISDDVFKLMVSATIATILFTPFLVTFAPTASEWIHARLDRLNLRDPLPHREETSAPALSGHVVIIGFGPAGQAVGADLVERGRSATVIDLNPQAQRVARQFGFEVATGDALKTDVLEHAHVKSAAAVLVALPSPTIAREVIRAVRGIAVDVPIVARARYHIYRWELEMAGASHVVDEETHAGLELSRVLAKSLEE